MLPKRCMLPFTVAIVVCTLSYPVFVKPFSLECVHDRFQGLSMESSWEHSQDTLASLLVHYFQLLVSLESLLQLSMEEKPLQHSFVFYHSSVTCCFVNDLVFLLQFLVVLVIVNLLALTINMAGIADPAFFTTMDERDLGFIIIKPNAIWFACGIAFMILFCVC